MFVQTTNFVCLKPCRGNDPGACMCSMPFSNQPKQYIVYLTARRCPPPQAMHPLLIFTTKWRSRCPQDKSSKINRLFMFMHTHPRSGDACIFLWTFVSCIYAHGVQLTLYVFQFPYLWHICRLVTHQATAVQYPSSSAKKSPKSMLRSIDLGSMYTYLVWPFWSPKGLKLAMLVCQMHSYICMPHISLLFVSPCTIL